MERCGRRWASERTFGHEPMIWSGWGALTCARTAGSARRAWGEQRSCAHERRHFLPLGALGLEPWQRALSAWHRPRTAAAWTWRTILRAGGRLERREPAGRRGARRA